MPSYFGTESTNAYGSTSSGYLIANGNVYPAVSGGGKFSDIPAGSYTHNDGETPRADQPTMTDGTGRQKFLKFLVVGSAAGGNIHEKRAYWSKEKGQPWQYHPNGGDRDGIELHYDGGNPGTAGCIGYQDPAAKQAIVDDPDKSVNVQYLDSDDAVKRAVELRLGHPVDWTKVNAPKKPGAAAAGSGVQSTTKKGKKVDKGHTKVLVGPKSRYIGHKQAALIGGGMVAEGNPTVVVGTERYPVARLEHMTTDGSPVADGESSVLLA
jgi:hypothetical protein